MTINIYYFYIKKTAQGFLITEGEGALTYLLKDGYLLERAKDFYCRPYVHGHGLVPDMDINSEHYLLLGQCAEVVEDKYSSNWLEIDTDFVKEYNDKRVRKNEDILRHHKEHTIWRIRTGDYPKIGLTQEEVERILCVSPAYEPKHILKKRNQGDTWNPQRNAQKKEGGCNWRSWTQEEVKTFHDNIVLVPDKYIENQNTMNIKEETLQQWEVWNKFKKLHPNSPEVFPNYTPQNIARWQYHITHAEDTEKLEPATINTSLLEKIRADRRVSLFEDFDAESHRNYSEIAAVYPGVQVYACGSRVRGDWWSVSMFGYYDLVLQARHEGGMRIDKYSDCDFWVPADAQPVKPLPVWADRYRGKFNAEQMVAIPIYNGI